MSHFRAVELAQNSDSSGREEKPMDLRTRLCFELSRLLMRPPEVSTVDYGAYDKWREESLASSWQRFGDPKIEAQDILDFGCGDGQLAGFIARHKNPLSVTGVDIDQAALQRARANFPDVTFIEGTVGGLPFPDRSFDVIVAFDMLEHVMQPGAILKELYRVLRDNGRLLIEWFPFKGAWGPHMESLIPIPWAHVLFGERAMFRAAEAIYDLSDFVPRHWDLDEHGRKKPNKWRQWSSFREQNYVNELDVPTVRRLAKEAGFCIERLDRYGFSGPAWRRMIGSALIRLPFLGDYFVVSTLIELKRKPR